MKITYSQKWTKEIIDNRIRTLLPFIPGIKQAKVWIKVFCYDPKNSYKSKFHGHYRWIHYHGIFKQEWEYYYSLKPKNRFEHIITLKIHPEISDKNLLYFIAHEFGHLKDWRKYKGKKHKCSQKRCDKFAYKCIEKWEKSKIQLKPLTKIDKILNKILED